MVVVANDKGYEPMLEHAKAMGFRVRRQPHGAVKPSAKKAAPSPVTAKKAAPKSLAAKKPVANVPSPSTAAKKASRPKALSAQGEVKAAAPTPAVATGAVVQGPGKVTAVPTPLSPSGASALPESLSSRTSVSVSATHIERITDQLRSVGVHRPTKPAALRRLLKSLLAAETGDASIEVALGKLLEAGTVVIDAEHRITYPSFEAGDGAPAP
jgi:hypothetical protein